MRGYRSALALLLVCSQLLLLPSPVIAENLKSGIVIMHGKGGSPARLVQELADQLETRGLLVANIEMTWSGDRQYDVGVDEAVAEIDRAIAGLKAKGAGNVYVCGHSQGGAFAIYYATTRRIDGLIAIVPGGDPGSDFLGTRLYRTVKLARKLVAAGKGNEVTELKDFEGRRGLFPVNTTPVKYLGWFEPEGAMNYPQQAKKITTDTPILWIESTNDLPALRRTNLELYNTLAKHPLTRLAEPEANHKGAPGASVSIIADWIGEVVKTR